MRDVGSGILRVRFGDLGSTPRDAFCARVTPLHLIGKEWWKSGQRNAGIKLFESVRGGSMELTFSTPASYTAVPRLCQSWAMYPASSAREALISLR